MRRGGGGLVTALRSLVAEHDVTWVASAIGAEDRAVAAESGEAGTVETARDGSRYRLRLVIHERSAYDRFYNVAANPTLWFLQHYLWDLPAAPNVDHGLHRAWDEGYEPVNRNFADVVTAELETEPEATVFFHDYHLYLAPRLVREAVPGASLAHFVHIPWPQPDLWYVLPERLRFAVHEGLLANDMVGFHTERWRRNFLHSCEEIAGAQRRGDDELDFGGRRVLVTRHPISVNARELEEQAASETVRAAGAEIAARRPERLLLRADRTDPSKNIVRGFLAFELYLDAHPEAHGRVGMLALLDPSRLDIPEYAEYLGAIQRTARAVNERFESGDWTPIDLQIRDDFAHTLAAYKQYDVLLVNAIFDGLNLVAKEAPLVNERDGAVILSENAGASEELAEWALTVNPFDVRGQAEAIHAAFELDAGERRARVEGIRDHVLRHDLKAWIDGQLTDLDGIGARSERTTA